MVSTEDFEKAQAGSEAREAVVRKPEGASVATIADGLRRYLGAELYGCCRAEMEQKGTHCARRVCRAQEGAASNIGPRQPPLAVPGHQVGRSRLMGAAPPSALWRR